MTFLSPWMLLGGAAVSIPLILHFFYRAKYRPVPWGAMKFLRLSIEQTSRRMRFQELVLLILRIAVLLFLALALARPANRALSSGSGGRGQAVDCVLLIDVSYSMNGKELGKSRLDRAKDAAKKVLAELPPRSTVQVVTFSDRATYLGPKSPTNFDQARLLIDAIEDVQLSTDLAPALNEALEAFNRSAGGNREVYVFSDMQRSAWQRQAGVVRTKAEEIKNQATLYLVRCADKPLKNLTLLSVTPETEVPHKGARTAFTVLVRNSGAEPVSNAKLTLALDGKNLDQDAVSLETIAPGETRAITITNKIEAAGYHVLSAFLGGPGAPADELEDDNRLDQVILVREKVRVLVIEGTPFDRSTGDLSAFTLLQALQPVAEEKLSEYFIQTTTLPARDVTPDKLIDQDVCIFCNAPLSGIDGVSEAFLKALVPFVNDGKGLFLIGGEKVNSADYNRLLDPLGLLPAKLTEPFMMAKDAKRAFFPDPNSIDPFSFLAKFKKREDKFQQITLASVIKALGVGEGKGTVLMKYDNGKPAVLRLPFGEGEVMLLTTSVDSRWGTFGQWMTFPPFVQGVIGDMIQRRAANYNRVVGEPLRYMAPDKNRSYVLETPKGVKTRLSRTPGERNLLTSNDTSRAGIYKLAAEGDNADIRFAYLPDLRESENLDSLSDTAIDEQLGFSPVHLSAGGTEGVTLDGNERSRQEWTTWLLGLVFLLAFGEALWAWACGRSW